MSRVPGQVALLCLVWIAGTASAQMFAQGFPCAGPDPVACVRDVNAKEASGYSLLATVLFNSRGDLPAQGGGAGARRYPKTELVRRLLDAGANANGDHGGRGRFGALGLARREEPEVVALLVARGATLAGATGRGPVATAIEMERDDLALALLGRERKPSPEDRAAIALAARRGWGHVVNALLDAGADPNATDAQGMTALKLAERRRDSAMMMRLAAAGASPSDKAHRPSPGPGAGFAELAAKEIDEVVFFDPPRFALAPGREGVFSFYGKGVNQFEEVRCEHSAAFEFIAMANQAGGLQVGICAREAKRVRELAAAAGPALEAVLGQLSQSGSRIEPSVLAKLGWRHARHDGADGTQEHFFALIAIGHGVLSLPTFVLVARGARRAFVVQADTTKLCENYGLGNQTPLCGDTRQALADIARRLESSTATRLNLAR